MGRAPCCSKVGLHRGPWTSREDALLTSFILSHGEGNWSSLPSKAGLLRCGKSCRLRWVNYLRPDIKRGNIGPEEEDLIIRLHRLLGNRWSLIAGRLPGRTDNEIKNYWNSHLSKKLKRQGFVLREAAIPRSKPSKSSSDGRNQNSNSNEIPKVYAPKPTRLTASVSSQTYSEKEKGSPDQEESGTDEIDVEVEFSDMINHGVEHHYFPDTDYMFFDHFEFGGQIMALQQEPEVFERSYDEYSQLWQPEVDMNLFGYHDHQYMAV